MPEIGWEWLAKRYGIHTIFPSRIRSKIGKIRRVDVFDGFTSQEFPPTFRPEESFAGHMTFTFKYEGIHLEFLARLFSLPEVRAELLEWIHAEPTGSYARRSAFFYEWFNEDALPVDDLAFGNYVDAVDGSDYFTSANPIRNKRWRVRDNLPGSSEFCPMIQLSDGVKAAVSYHCADKLVELEAKFGTDIIQRSAVWLTIKESRASFAIEHEEDQSDRIKRFAAVIESRCGKDNDPLSGKSLLNLQSEILGENTTQYGLRKSPVFVGHASGYIEVVDYIAPHFTDINSLLDGLRYSLHSTTGQSSIIRAAIASFGFVYIHPMSDGNGRISRFLVNDILRRDKAIPEPYILPISATITHTAIARAGYDKSLEYFSKPLMNRCFNQYRFGQDQEYADGIHSNFEFSAYDEMLPAWRYPDLTSHSEYLFAVIRQTIEQEMNDEAQAMRSIHQARRNIKEVLEAPDTSIDRIIRSIKESNWVISAKLIKEFPILKNDTIATAVAGAVRRAFQYEELSDDVEDMD